MGDTVEYIFTTYCKKLTSLRPKYRGPGDHNVSNCTCQSAVCGIGCTVVRSHATSGVAAHRLPKRTSCGFGDYLNIDFAQYLGQELYNFIAGSMDALNSGVGEWMFRQVAFPDVPDNADQFYRRYYHHLRRPDGKSWWNQILEKRTGVNALLETLMETHGLYQSDLVGFTSMFAQNVPCFALAKKLKLHNPNIVTVMGGANCETSMGEEIMKRVEVIDYVFSGPALVSFPQFVDYYIEGEFSKCAALDGVFPSASRREPAVTVPHTLNILGSNSAADAVPKAPIGKELDIDFKIDLDYSQFLDTVYRAFPEQASPLLFFETSRGCWWGEKPTAPFAV
jgi:hypothetical protein